MPIMHLRYDALDTLASLDGNVRIPLTCPACLKTHWWRNLMPYRFDEGIDCTVRITFHDVSSSRSESRRIVTGPSSASAMQRRFWQIRVHHLPRSPDAASPDHRSAVETALPAWVGRIRTRKCRF